MKADADPRIARRLFAVLLILVAALPVFLIADQRLVRGHQTRLYYETQYAVLSSGTVPVWLPFTAGGVESGPALHGQAGILQSALLLAAPAVAGSSFLPIFHLGLFVEELLLLVGCWLLARRHFASPYTAFFVSVAALGSSFGLDNLALNVHSIYALPLILALVHDFLDSGSRAKLLLAGNLAAVQALGSPPGMGLAAPLVAAMYFIVLRPPLRAVAGRKSDAWVILAIAASWLPSIVTGWGPSAAGSSPRDILVYAGLANPLRYLDFFIGATPSLDWSLYCGFLTMGFATVAILTGPRAAVIRALVALPLGLLLLGTALSLVSQGPAAPVGTPFVRLFVVFLAGVGVQRMLDAAESAPLLKSGRLLGVVALVLTIASLNASLNSSLLIILLQLVSGEPSAATSSPALEPWTVRVGSSLLPDLLGASALCAFLAAMLLLAWGSGRRAAPLAVTLILVLHPLDLFSWKFRMSWLETYRANPVQAAMQKLEPPPFPARQVASLKESPRFAEFHQVVRGHQNPQYVPRGEPTGAEAAAWHAAVSDGPPADRTNMACQVLEFTPNRVKLQVHAAEPGMALVYRDRFSPSWRATVNGEPREITDARPGKQVRLDAGKNVVLFWVRAPLRTFAFLLVRLNALFWLLWILRAALRRGEAA